MTTARLLKTKDAAKYLSVHPVTLLNMVYAGKIPRVQEAKNCAMRFKIADLDAWIEKHNKVEGAA